MINITISMILNQSSISVSLLMIFSVNTNTFLCFYEVQSTLY